MTLLRWLFYYIGSIYFAVTLIGVSALYVALGTFLESSSDSHAYAAQLSYGHPLFQLLLWGYFVNILTSALRRWPFHKSHAPFLLTHLGLLMLLGGTIFKSYYGVQGTMAVMEGSGSQSIFLPGSESLHVETRDGTQQFPLTKHPLRGYDAVLAADSPKITLLDYKPHGRESFQLWFKPHWAEIKGLPNLPIQEWQPDHRLIPSFKARFFEDSNKDVAIYAVDAPSVAAVLEHWFCNRGTVLRQDASDGTTVEQRPPSASEFELPRSPLVQTTCKGFQPTSELCSLQVEPSIFLIRDAMGAQTVCAVSCDGALSYRAYRSDTIPPLYVLDKGYQGYAVLAELEIALDSPAAFEQRQARLQELEQQLSREFQGEGELPSCLQILLNACNGDPTRASQALIATLSLMDADQTRVLKAERPLPEQLQTVMDGLQWDLDPVLRHGGLWAAQLVPELESASSGGADIAELLASRHWPLSKDLQEIEDRNAVLTAFTQQVFMLASQLPEPPRPVQERANENAQIFSSCLTAYGFDLRHLLASIPVASTKRGLEIECSAQAIYESADPSRKLEANTPFITVAIEADGKKEVMQLPYDRYGTGLKWPALDGRYLVRYQPQFQTLPHRIRLHQARQLSYAGSAQAFSFESDVTVLENGKDEKVATLSMNRVYETRDGYRFYMANLYPPTPGQIKQAQIVVNQDPVRYTVTYPGAILMAFGSIWLFWRRRRKFEKKERVL